MNIDLLSVVALLEDQPAQGLVRGHVGTVVENWAPDVHEVEFSDESGQAYATVALKANQLMLLHHEPAHHRHEEPPHIPTQNGRNCGHAASN
jgi:hypothetical protein